MEVGQAPRVRVLRQLHVRHVARARAEAEQARLVQVAPGHEHARPERRLDRDVARRRDDGAGDREASVAERERVADARGQRLQQRLVHDRGALGPQARPRLGRRRRDGAVERVAALDGRDLGETRARARRDVRHRLEARDARDLGVLRDPGQLRLRPLREAARADPAERSAPSSARAWPRTASRRSSVKELTATSAATPTEHGRRQHPEPAERGAALAPGHPQHEADAAGHAAAESETTEPSARRSTRRARRARSASWVTSTSVVPDSRFSSESSSITWAPVAASRLPVGSSANRRRGRWRTRAPAPRAAARRPRAAPGSGGRARRGRRARAARRARRRASVACPRSSSGTCTFSRAVSVGEQLERLEDEADLLAAQPRARVLVERRQVLPVHDAPRPERGRSRPASRPSSVVLPLPDGPRIARKPPGSRSKLTPRRTVRSRPPDA